MRTLAISDIHGCKKTLLKLLDRVGLNQDDKLVLAGDYIDRGPDSKGVIDTLMNLKKDGYQVKCLLGNHEAMLLMAGENIANNRNWLANGGLDTLDSFGLYSTLDMPENYLQFFREMDVYYETEDAIFVHAGLNFTYENPMEDEESMLWIRGWYPHIDRDWLGSRIIVHGHTPVSGSYIRSQMDRLVLNQVINIDCGCVYPREGQHQLCGLDLTNRKLYFEPNADD